MKERVAGWQLPGGARDPRAVGGDLPQTPVCGWRFRESPAHPEPSAGRRRRHSGRVLHPILAVVLGGFGFYGSDVGKCIQGALVLLSPLAAPAGNEMAQLHSFPPFDSSPFSGWRAQGFRVAPLIVAVNFTFYAALLFLFRHLALSRADRYLRR